MSEPSEYFDEREFGIRAELETRHYWHLHRREVVRAELERYLAERARGAEGPAAPPSSGPGGTDAATRLIELGCGVGTVATHLNRHGLWVDYADAFPQALDIARRRAGITLGAEIARRDFLLRDITQPLPPLPHEGILLLDVLEHLPHDVEVLRNIRRALAPGAFLFLTVPAFQLLWSPWDEVQKHKRRYTEASLRQALEVAGFSVQRCTYFFAPLFFAALGVKGLREARRLAGLRAEPTDRIDRMVEGKHRGWLGQVVLRVLSLERPGLARGRLPLGTSLLAVATPREHPASSPST